MRSPFAPLVALLALGLLIFVAARFYPASIEADIAARANAALADAGLDGVTVSADGRDVRLTGEVENELARAKATRITGAVAGVRRIDNALAVQGFGTASTAASPAGAVDGTPSAAGRANDAAPEDRRPWQTRISVSERELVLEGDAPNPAFRERLAETVPDRFPGLAVADSLVVRTDEAGDAAGAALEAALAELPEFVEGDARLTAARLAVSGRLRPGVDPLPMEQRLRRALPEGYRLDFDVIAGEAPEDDQESTRAPEEPAAAAAGSDGVQPSCQREVDKALADGGVVFAFGSVEVDPAARAVLDRVAEALLACPGQRVEVGGHTDSAGDAEVNRRISEARAVAVTRYLTRAGVPEERLTAVGYGETRPVADNSTPEGRRQNRRIEFQIAEPFGEREG